MPNGYIKSKKGNPIEIVDAKARQDISGMQTDFLELEEKVDNLPTTGGEQSDWNETDESKISFIKNKPNIDNAFIVTFTPDNMGAESINENENTTRGGEPPNNIMSIPLNMDCTFDELHQACLNNKYVVGKLIEPYGGAYYSTLDQIVNKDDSLKPFSFLFSLIAESGIGGYSAWSIQVKENSCLLFVLLDDFALKSDIEKVYDYIYDNIPTQVTDEHINSLIDTKIGDIESALQAILGGA